MSGRPRGSLPPGYFERIYARDPDPWGFETSAYERAKYRATLDALPRQHYGETFEIGCSIGVLTALLAARCARVLAVDVLEQVLTRARMRCAGLAHVVFERMQVPKELPQGRFDLIVVSEVGYYLGTADLDRLADFCRTRLLPGGHAVLVHWTPEATDYPLTGDQVHERMIAVTKGALDHRFHRREPSWRLDLLERPPARARES